MLELCTIASGSSGNAVLVYNEKTVVLIDAGVSAKRICDGMKSLGIAPADLGGICITHSHSDHISGLRVLLKRTGAVVYTCAATANALREQVDGIEGRIEVVEPLVPFQIGTLEITPFPTPHDAPGSAGYSVTDGIRKCSVVTDLGFVTEDVRHCVLGSQLAMVEANHDPEWLKSGPYPYYLKRRILGDGGHLSNEDSGELCCELAAHGTRKLVLAHLSRENNTPERARNVVCNMLACRGFQDVSVTVAPCDRVAAPIEV